MPLPTIDEARARSMADQAAGGRGHLCTDPTACDGRCSCAVCGDIILADTEDLQQPLCFTCYEKACGETG